MVYLKGEEAAPFTCSSQTKLFKLSPKTDLKNVAEKGEIVEKRNQRPGQKDKISNKIFPFNVKEQSTNVCHSHQPMMWDRTGKRTGISKVPVTSHQGSSQHSERSPVTKGQLDALPTIVHQVETQVNLSSHEQSQA